MEDAAILCQSIKRGEDITFAIEKLEPKIKHFCEVRDKNIFTLRREALCAEDALYDVSASIKNYWNTVYRTFQNPQEKYQALLKFVNAGEKYLGTSHTESIRKLKTCGWTAADIMATYINNRIGISRLNLSPDVAAQAAKEDWSTALRLLESESYQQYFPYRDSTYYPSMQFAWIDFMYYFLEYEDQTFLKLNHKRKRLCKHCQTVLEKLEHPATNEKLNLKSTDCPDFSVFQNITLQQQHLLRSAAAQRLQKGNDENAYYVQSFHLVDEDCGCGAALCFEPLNKSPDYFNTTVKSHGVYFYRFHYLYLSDYIPESQQQIPENMPEKFVKQAYRSFSMIAGLTKNK